MSEEQERIVSVAIRIGTRIYALSPPKRHHDVIRRMSELGHGPQDMHDQGFATNKGRFVDRADGWRIAHAADQIIKVTGSPGVLFSEDLW